MSQKIRQEINLIVNPSLGTGTVTSNGLSQMDTTKYSGSPTYWFEAVFSGAASNTGTIKLRDVTGATNVASLSGATSATFIISRVQFTPTAGAREYTLQMVGDGTRTQTVNCARIIVLQDEAAVTATDTQIEIGANALGLNNTSVADIPSASGPKYWKYNSANWDGTPTFGVEIVWTTSAKNTTTITLCRTSDNAANVTIVNAGSNSTGYTRTRVSFTPVDGETYKLRTLGSTTKSTYSVNTSKIIVTQGSSPTKLEPQFLLDNSPTGGTGVANKLTTWNSGEWDASTGTITYYHAIDGQNTTSCKLRDVTAGSDITNSTVTSTGTQVVSSALGAFTSTNTLDCSVLTNPTDADRILVVYVFVAAAARRIFVTGG